MKITSYIFRKLSFVFIPLYRLYAKKPHSYRFRKLKIKVRPRIFNPILFHSTIDLIIHIESQDFNDMKILELGCGTGMSSIFFAKKSWDVTASDINKKALENAAENAEINNVQVRFVESDLFEKLNMDQFDLILINPPYFPRDPKNTDEMAWYCGSSFDYFTRLFDQLKRRHEKNEKVYMVLSDGCEINVIRQIADKFNLKLELEKQIAHFYENILIFHIS